MQETIVIFRKYPEGDIIALFPTIPATRFTCESYQHIGQHSGADYDWVIASTKPATPEEYRPLYNELCAIGYDDLRIMQKRPINVPRYFANLPY